MCGRFDICFGFQSDKKRSLDVTLSKTSHTYLQMRWWNEKSWRVYSIRGHCVLEVSLRNSWRASMLLSRNFCDVGCFERVRTLRNFCTVNPVRHTLPVLPHFPTDSRYRDHRDCYTYSRRKFGFLCRDIASSLSVVSCRITDTPESVNNFERSKWYYIGLDSDPVWAVMTKSQMRSGNFRYMTELTESKKQMDGMPLRVK